MINQEALANLLHTISFITVDTRIDAYAWM